MTASKEEDWSEMKDFAMCKFLKFIFALLYFYTTIISAHHPIILPAPASPDINTVIEKPISPAILSYLIETIRHFYFDSFRL